MRILANENFPGPVVRGLRGAGHDVSWTKEEVPGASDADVLDRARAERRLLVTFDKDFGELAFRADLPAESGIILFRLSGSNPAVDNARALAALMSREDWAGRFSVVEDSVSLRERFLAKALSNSLILREGGCRIVAHVVVSDAARDSCSGRKRPQGRKGLL